MATETLSPTAQNTPIERLNPWTKILAVFALGISALIFPTPWLGAALVVVLFVIAHIARILGPFTKIMLGFGIPVTLMLVFIQGGYSPKNVTVIAHLGFLTLGLEGVLYALKVVFTVLVFLGSFYIMNKTTYTGRLVAALTSSGFPAKAGYLILASLNVVPHMQRRISIIQEAQAARGLETSGGLFARIGAYIPLLGPVVLSSLTDAQERGMTLETRGFGAKGVRHTTYIDVPFRRSDAVICVILGAFFVIVLAVTLMMRTGVLG